MHAAALSILLLSAGQLSMSGPTVGNTGTPVRVAVTGIPKFATIDEMYGFRAAVTVDAPEGVATTVDQSLAYDVVKQSWKLLIDVTADNSGVYVVLFGSGDGGDVVLLSHRITIGKVPPPKPDPEPEPEPEPGPDPNPNPKPASDFAKAVKAAWLLVDEDGRGRAAMIANNYRWVADQAVAAPTMWTPARMQDVVKTRHSGVLTVDELRAWHPFWTPLAQAFVGLDLDASDLDGHIKAFQEVAEVMNDAATTR